jgi:putative selenate reductase
VAMGLVPVTVCTDLLRPRGYGRQAGYLKELEAAMRAVGAATVDEYVLRARGDGAAPDRGQAVLRNTRAIAAETLEDPRYGWERNRREPNKVGSHLYTFDCLSCDKCLPVCPNDANFSFLVEPERFPYRDYRLSRGDLLPDESHWHAIERERQFATYADFCNECGNCDTFCPEHGGPFLEKPLLFGSRESWTGRPGRDGCYVEREGDVDRIVGRAGARTYRLEVARARDEAVFDDGTIEMRLRLSTRELLGWRALDPALAVPDPARPPHRHMPDHVVSMGVMYRMETILCGVLYERRVNYVNAPFLAPGAEAVETVEAAALVR